MIYFVVATYKQEKELERILGNLSDQTDKDFSVIVVHDGPFVDKSEEVLNKTYPFHLEYYTTKERENKWGHNCRDLGLHYALNLDIKKGKGFHNSYLSFTNADNEYFSNAVQVFNSLKNQEVNVLLAQIRHSYFNYSVLDVEFKAARCDFMNMAIRMDLLVETGFPFRGYAADAHLIEHIIEYYTPVINKSNEIIGKHN